MIEHWFRVPVEKTIDVMIKAKDLQEAENKLKKGEWDEELTHSEDFIIGDAELIEVEEETKESLPNDNKKEIIEKQLSNLAQGKLEVRK